MAQRRPGDLPRLIVPYLRSVRQHRRPCGSAPPSWAGECRAIEAELTAKTLTRTTAIMRELLARTGDYSCVAGDARVPGLPPRHTRVIYLCSPAATGTVLRARDALGSLGARVEVRAAARCRDAG
jgi:hypothetical protein